MKRFIIFVIASLFLLAGCSTFRQGGLNNITEQNQLVLQSLTRRAGYLVASSNMERACVFKSYCNVFKGAEPLDKEVMFDMAIDYLRTQTNIDTLTAEDIKDILKLIVDIPDIDIPQLEVMDFVIFAFEEGVDLAIKENGVSCGK